MTVQIVTDPFSLVMNAMWKQVENTSVITQQIKTGNMVRFNHDHDRGPIKTQVITADLPELFLVPTSLAGGETNIHATSNDLQVCQTFHWLLNTGDLRATSYAMPIGWALLCAMANWQNWPGQPLLWQGSSFMKKVEVRGGAVGYSDIWRNKGITGWTLLSEVEVTMRFQTVDVLKYAGS